MMRYYMIGSEAPAYPESNPVAKAHGRPLVVIDPEDRDAVERLWIVLRDGLALRSRDNLTAALREFANPTPPKPDEPLGLGAVVESVNGDLWVRIDADGVWACSSAKDKTATFYDAIAAVRVLSEGVPT